MKVASFVVSPELLAKRFSLPSGVTFVGAVVDPLTGELKFTVTHDALVDQPEGAVGECLPTFTWTTEGGSEFVGWGQSDA